MRSTNVLRLKFVFFLICDTLSGLVLLTEILFLPFLSLLHKMSYYLPYFFIKETQSQVFFSFIAQQTVSRASCVSAITTAIMWFLPIADVKITLFKGSWGGGSDILSAKRSILFKWVDANVKIIHWHRPHGHTWPVIILHLLWKIRPIHLALPLCAFPPTCLVSDLVWTPARPVLQTPAAFASQRLVKWTANKLPDNILNSKSQSWKDD